MCFFFSETVEKNIAFYDETASHERVEWAAQTAQAADFINNLQEGYQTIIGERGVGLSGGQKQRISIARALLKNAPIIILMMPAAHLIWKRSRRLQRVCAGAAGAYRGYHCAQSVLG